MNFNPPPPQDVIQAGVNAVQELTGAQLAISGRVFHAPGPWGAATPAAGVAIDIIENHILPPSTDTVWNGQSGSDGRFSGTVSVETDVPTLTARVKDTNGATREVTLPFVYVPDVPSLLVVPWAPPLVGRVNGISCWSAGDFAAKALAAVQVRRPVRLEVFASAGEFEHMRRILEPFIGYCQESFARASRGSPGNVIANRMAGQKPYTLQTRVGTLKGFKEQTSQRSLQSGASMAQAQEGIPIDRVPDIILIIIYVLISMGLLTVTVTTEMALTGTVVTFAAFSLALSVLTAILTASVLAVAVVAVVTAAVTVVQSLAQLLQAVALILRTCGFLEVANEVENATAWWDSNVASQQWFLIMCLVILLICTFAVSICSFGLVAGAAWDAFLQFLRCFDERGRQGVAVLLGS
jgi:hypothetical protein